MNDTEALLSQLRGIHAPDVSIIPAIGWWILLTVIVAVLFAIRQLARRYQSRGWQREAKRELQRLREEAADAPVSQSLASTSRLVRRVALAARPRTEVASLQGEAWLRELDDICGQPLFMSGFGSLLDQGPYQPESNLDSKDLDALFDVVEQLIGSASGQTSSASGKRPS